MSVVVVAGALRLADLDLIEFKRDEAVAIDLAMPLVEGRELPKVGLVNSAGLRNPPLFLWLVALPAWFSVEPRFVTAALIGVPCTLAVLFTWLILRARFGPVVAVSAAAFYAVAPWPVLYSRKLWAQDCLPLLSVALLWATFVFFERKKTRWVALIPLALGALWQLHLSAVGMVGLYSLLLLWKWRRVHWLALGAGCLGAGLMLWPYIDHQIENGYADVRGFLKIAEGRRPEGTARTEPRNWSLDSFRWATYISAGNDLAYAAGPSLESLRATRSAAARKLRGWGQAVSWALLAAGCLLLGFWSIRRAVWRWRGVDDDEEADLPPMGRRAGLVLLVWLLGFPAIFTALRLEALYPHYFTILFPAPFAVMALGIGELSRRGGRIGRSLAVGLVAIVLIANLATLGAFRNYVEREGGTRGDYGVSIGHKQALARWIVGSDAALAGRTSYELAHLVRMERRFGSREAAAVQGHGPAAAGWKRVRVFDTFRQPRARRSRCPERRDFGPLVACPVP